MVLFANKLKSCSKTHPFSKSMGTSLFENVHHIGRFRKKSTFDCTYANWASTYGSIPKTTKKLTLVYARVQLAKS